MSKVRQKRIPICAFQFYVHLWIANIREPFRNGRNACRIPLHFNICRGFSAIFAPARDTKKNTRRFGRISSIVRSVAIMPVKL